MDHVFTVGNEKLSFLVVASGSFLACEYGVKSKFHWDQFLVTSS